MSPTKLAAAVAAMTLGVAAVSMAQPGKPPPAAPPPLGASATASPAPPPGTVEPAAPPPATPSAHDQPSTGAAAPELERPSRRRRAESPDADEAWSADRPPPGFGPSGATGAASEGGYATAAPESAGYPATTAPATGDVATDAPSRSTSPGEHTLEGVATRGEIGGYLAVIPGAAGLFKNDSPAFSTGVALAVGRHRVRYHFAAGFMYRTFPTTSSTSVYDPVTQTFHTSFHSSSSGFGGFHLEPATMGIPIMVHEGTVGVAIEPLINFLSWDIGSAGGLLMSWQMGVATQVVVNYKRFAVAVCPFNLEFRPFILADHGFGGVDLGMNWPVNVSAGYRF